MASFGSLAGQVLGPESTSIRWVSVPPRRFQTTGKPAFRQSFCIANHIADYSVESVSAASPKATRLLASITCINVRWKPGNTCEIDSLGNVSSLHQHDCRPRGRAEVC